MNSLLRKRVLHVDDKPIWFDVYALHPPYNEPRYDQKAPEGDVREIFYEEDLIRAYVIFMLKLKLQSPNMLNFGKTNIKKLLSFSQKIP